jgi:hypothetical protein
MDCNLARQLLEFARPGAPELEADDADALEQHLTGCPDCGPYARAERAFDAAVARSMADIPLPPGGRDRLRTRLLAARGAWWRRTLLRSLTALAALLLAVSVGAWYWGRPALDPAAAVLTAYAQSGLWRGPEEAQALVTDWLRQLDDRLRAPEELNYKLLASLERSDFQGKSSVPTMVFVRGDAIMRVYVVRAHAFRNLDSVDDQPVEEGGCTFLVRRYANMPGWVFIFVSAGAAPDTFNRPVKPMTPA